ncbi:Bardet-Biedl syndrome 2 protein [Cichlidogyrus casuarinus]|uniref:Bardet-Biedl syndrome 2 protein n=1 Tax=Cichlidogyrus casuarinus TaxID=1844966 RepID=A0ABD2QGM4_9PLAT
MEHESNSLCVKSTSKFAIKSTPKFIFEATIDNEEDGIFLFGFSESVAIYNLEKDEILAEKNIADRVNDMVFFMHEAEPRILIGGNCSLLCLNIRLDEIFWTITGDNVTNVTTNGTTMFLAASEDYDIRFFDQDGKLQSEVSETGILSKLVHLHDDVFAYSIHENNFGVYQKEQKLWQKSGNSLELIGMKKEDGHLVCTLFTEKLVFFDCKSGVEMQTVQLQKPVKFMFPFESMAILVHSEGSISEIQPIQLHARQESPKRRVSKTPAISDGALPPAPVDYQIHFHETQSLMILKITSIDPKFRIRLAKLTNTKLLSKDLDFL